MTVAREPTLAVENGAAPPHRQPTGVRASDRERQDVVDRLHRALGEGRLDLDETDARVAAAYAARTREDLVPLVADLPPDDEIADGKAPDRAAIWTSVVWRLQMLVWGADERQPSDRRSRSVASRWCWRSPSQCGSVRVRSSAPPWWPGEPRVGAPGSAQVVTVGPTGGDRGRPDDRSWWSRRRGRHGLGGDRG